MQVKHHQTRYIYIGWSGFASQLQCPLAAVLSRWSDPRIRNLENTSQVHHQQDRVGLWVRDIPTGNTTKTSKHVSYCQCLSVAYTNPLQLYMCATYQTAQTHFNSTRSRRRLYRVTEEILTARKSCSLRLISSRRSTRVSNCCPVPIKSKSCNKHLTESPAKTNIPENSNIRAEAGHLMIMLLTGHAKSWSGLSSLDDTAMFSTSFCHRQSALTVTLE